MQSSRRHLSVCKEGTFYSALMREGPKSGEKSQVIHDQLVRIACKDVEHTETCALELSTKEQTSQEAMKNVADQIFGTMDE